MRDVPPQASRQFDVFTSGQALTSGWTPSALERAAAADRLRRVRRGVYAVPTIASGFAADRRVLVQDAVGAALTQRYAVVGHAAAAVAHELPLLWTPSIPCLTTVTTRSTVPGVHLHRGRVPPQATQDFGPVAFSNVARTCVELANEFGRDMGIVTADAALRNRLVTRTALAAAARHYDGRGVRQDVYDMVTMADARSESPLESISRTAMAGRVPPPELQVRLFDHSGRFLGRGDFWWPEFGLLGEADGREKYSDDALWREKQRQDAFELCGVVVMRWGWRLAHDPARLADHIWRHIRKAQLMRSRGVVAEVSAGF